MYTLLFSRTPHKVVIPPCVPRTVHVHGILMMNNLDDDDNDDDDACTLLLTETPCGAVAALFGSLTTTSISP